MIFRSECASCSSKSILKTILESVPSKMKRILQCKNLFLFNEFMFVPSRSDSFRKDEEEIFSMKSTKFTSIIFVIKGSLELAMKHSSGRIDKIVASAPHHAVLFASDTSYRFLSTSNAIVWIVQYSDLKYKIAFSVPTCTKEDISSQSSSSETRKVLSNTNGVLVEENDDRVMFQMKYPGDCVLVPGKQYHQSVPSEESDVMLIKMVVFFSSHTDRIKKARKFQTPINTAEAFRELLAGWSSIFTREAIFSTYDEYYLTNSETLMDQTLNVRRVHAHRLEQFYKSFPKCAVLIRHLSTALGGCQVFDLHFLRQVGSNSASFSRHVDMHDTDNTETTNITCGVSVLLGGFTNCCSDDSHTERKKKRQRLEPTWLQFLDDSTTNEVRLKYENAIRRVGLIKDRFFCSNEEEVCLEGCNCDDKTCLDCKCRFECGPGCSCTISLCKNRIVQKKLRKTDTLNNFRVRWFNETKGFGVYTKTVLQKGSVLFEYVGEVITNLQRARERMNIRESMESMQFVLTVLERSHLDKNKIEQVTCIDAHRYGNISRFVNHSCDPNCDVECVRVGFKTPRLVFVAKRDIPIGSEITISYGDGSDRGIGGGRPCKCGSKNCLGTLPRFSQF